MNEAIAQEVQTALQSLLPAGFACAVTDPQRFDQTLMPREAEAIAKAQPRRKTEFVAGRRAARRAMVSLGVAPAPIPAGPDRAPIWPPGLIGSISHCETICVAVVAAQHKAQSVGIDIEPAVALENDLFSSICTQNEIDRLHGPDRLLQAKQIFSAKEAAFKAQYPLTQSLIGFDAMEVTLDLEKPVFKANFTRDVDVFGKGDAVNGHCVKIAGHFISSVTIEHIK